MRRLGLLLAALGFAAFLVLAAGAAQAQQPLVADLSQHLIRITTGFSGTEVLLFGATEGEGDVVVVVRGPDISTVVRRKSRELGIWVNSSQMTFTGVPSFYRVASSRPLADITTPQTQTRHQLGIENLRFNTLRPSSPQEIAEFRTGLLRNREREQLFAADVGPVTFLGQRLFRAPFQLPANVPTGVYQVHTLLIQNGEVVAEQVTPLFVNKSGVGADVFEFAHRQPAIYGILAVLIAIGAGWAASAVFRKG
jgi:uncharacterized protein (TIGR02186 family)